MTGSNVAMSDRVRDQGEGLIIAFPSKQASIVGTTAETLKGYFFKVAATQEFYYEYDELTEFDNGDSENYNYLGDGGLGTGDDILRQEKDDFHVYHFGVGMETTDLRVYEKVDPSSGGNTPLDYSGSDGEPDPTTPSSFGYYTGAMTGNQYDPAAITERVSFRNDRDGEYLQFGFYAEDDIPESATTLHLVGRGYKLLPVTDSDTRKEMIRAINKADEDADIPTALVTSGGLDQFNIGTQLPDDWDDRFADTLAYGTGAEV